MHQSNCAESKTKCGERACNAPLTVSPVQLHFHTGSTMIVEMGSCTMVVFIRLGVRVWQHRQYINLCWAPVSDIWRTKHRIGYLAKRQSRGHGTKSGCLLQHKQHKHVRTRVHACIAHAHVRGLCGTEHRRGVLAHTRSTEEHTSRANSSKLLSTASGTRGTRMLLYGSVYAEP